jgi:FtsP/CotA-like multicopper oxidase with cupredoxin domain
MTLTAGCNLIVIAFTSIASIGVAATESDARVCERPPAGSTVTSPASLRSSRGELRAAFTFSGRRDDVGLTRYCYVYQNGIESPTLRVSPGDEVLLDLTNAIATQPSSMQHQHGGGSCSGGPMTAASTNLHFHGLAIPPACHQDDAIRTSIQPFEPAFPYRFRVPASQSPGLYWYHPHPHGYTEGQVLGGASGALIVEGIERLKPQVAGLPERILILRDQIIPGRGSGRKGTEADPDDATGKDVSLNFVPVTYPLYMPAVLRVLPDRREFWRVLNASADTYFTLQVISVEQGRRVPQSLQLMAMDGAAAGDQVSASLRTEMLISPGGRAEFILSTPHAGAFTQLISRNYDTGPDGAANPTRVIANIISSRDTAETQSANRISATPPSRFNGLTALHPAQVRRLYFSEDLTKTADPNERPRYFITVGDKTPALFDMNFKVPDITARQGTVEDWIIENRAREAHVFHIHQVHFQLLGRNGIKVDEEMLRDTIDLPYWDGTSAVYPSVRLRMDFRAPQIIGTFLFHCHILEHEDGGMMGSVEVVKAR